MLVTMLTVAFLASSCGFMQSSLQTAPRDGVYLIPSGFVGTVIILYSQPDGVVPDVEENFYVYKIPPSGVLKVRTPPYHGMVDLKYFYVNQKGDRHEVKHITITGDHDPQGRPQNKYGNLSADEVENSIVVMNPSGVGEFTINAKTVQFSRLVIGKPKESEKLFDEYRKRLIEVQSSLSNR